MGLLWLVLQKTAVHAAKQLSPDPFCKIRCCLNHVLLPRVVLYKDVQPRGMIIFNVD